MALRGFVVAPLHLRFGALSADNYPAIDVSPRGGSSMPKTRDGEPERGRALAYIWQIAGNCLPFVCKSIQCSPGSELHQSSSRASTGSGKRGHSFFLFALSPKIASSHKVVQIVRKLH